MRTRNEYSGRERGKERKREICGAKVRRERIRDGEKRKGKDKRRKEGKIVVDECGCERRITEEVIH